MRGLSVEHLLRTLSQGFRLLEEPELEKVKEHDLTNFVLMLLSCQNWNQ